METKRSYGEETADANRGCSNGLGTWVPALHLVEDTEVGVGLGIRVVRLFSIAGNKIDKFTFLHDLRDESDPYSRIDS